MASFAEGQSAGAQGFAAGTQAGLASGAMLLNVGDRIASGIERTRALLLRREQEKDRDRRVPEIEAQLKEIRQPYLLKQAEIQSTMKQLRVNPEDVDKKQLGLLLEEGMLARADVNDKTLQLLMNVTADANPLFAEHFKGHAAAAFKAWENDAAVFENMTKAIAEEEFNEQTLGIESRKAGAQELSARAEMLRAQASMRRASAEEAKAIGITPEKYLDSFVLARDSALQDFDNMPPDDQSALLKRARAQTGNEDLTLSDIRRSFAGKLTKRWMTQAGFPWNEPPREPAPPPVPREEPQPEEKTYARRAGEEFGELLRESPPARIARDMFKNVNELAEFIYGTFTGKPDQE